MGFYMCNLFKLYIWINIGTYILYYTTCYEQLIFTNRTKVDSSSFYTYGDYVGSADKTIDKNFDQSFKNCMHTAPGKKEAWLRLDLGDIYNLKSVKIWYRNDRNTDRLRGFRLLTTHSANTSQENSNLCYEDPGNATLKTVLEVDCTQRARYVTIYKKDENEAILEICEVEIYGCQRRRYGENCVPCDTCGIDCDITGWCYGLGCVNNIGYHGPYCKVCPPGKHGFDCKETCGYCNNNESCHHVTGSCPGFCEPGFDGVKCLSQCQKGFYGQKCTLPCGHCSGNASCNHVNGSCPSGYCEPGWKHNLNRKCNQECDNGTFGWYCTSNCSGNCAGGLPCNKVNGRCPVGCENGWINSYCNETCSPGRYGKNCQEKCNHCMNKEHCHHTNGSCFGRCKPGYDGEKCLAKCSPGKYGEDCKEKCGHCKNNKTCDHVTGSCPGLCEPGYSGDNCLKLCSSGRYGKDCKENCGHCVNNETCHHISGSCPGLCEAGYRGRKCVEACNDGWYGKECKGRCGYCRGNKPRHHVTGSCLALCEPGYSGDKCVFSQHLANQSELIKLIRELVAYRRRKIELRRNGTSPTDF